MPFKRLSMTLEMIKFEHSVFALPFAVTGALLAFREGSYTAAAIGRTLLWIAVAMVGARSAAMAFNRLVDASIDGRNPRTKMRHLPAGLLSRGFGWAFVIAASLIFFVAAWALNPLCLKLAPLALGIVFFYSFTKRFTSFSHLVLVWSLHLGGLAMAGVAAIVALLLYEHSLVKPNDLSRVNAAFFTMNGYVSVLFLIFWAADIFLLKPGA